jgi:tRNA dimethylallyltransferase
MKSLIVIVGPTAVGKTSLAAFLCKEFGGEVISADSRQVYRYMDIGTGKPGKRIREEIPHHLIDVVDPDEDFTVADFKREAEKAISFVTQRGALPFLVGGCGLYVRAVLDGLFPFSKADKSLRNTLLEQADERGKEYLYEKLLEVDPKSASRINVNDLRRVIRALEVFYKSGLPISYHQERHTQKNKYHLLMIGLNLERKKLYERIDRRVDRMIQDGFVEEVQWLLSMGYKENLVSMEGLGYKHMIQFLRGKMKFDEAVSTLKRDTRRYAKRQLTWFRKDRRIKWFEPKDLYSICELIEEYLLERRRVNGENKSGYSGSWELCKCSDSRA